MKFPEIHNKGQNPVAVREIKKVIEELRDEFPDYDIRVWGDMEKSNTWLRFVVKNDVYLAYDYGDKGWKGDTNYNTPNSDVELAKLLIEPDKIYRTHDDGTTLRKYHAYQDIGEICLELRNAVSLYDRLPSNSESK